MSWSADLTNETMVASGDHVRAIGWLSSSHPYSKSEVPVMFLTRLREFVRLANESASALSLPAFGGFHICELCEQARDSRNFGVPCESILYVAPGMVAHYVEQHGYSPPAEFVAAVMNSPLPDAEEYKFLVEPFRELHKQAWDRRFQERIDYAGRWALEHGGSEEAVREASSSFFGYTAPEMCERIRRSMAST